MKQYLIYFVQELTFISLNFLFPVLYLYHHHLLIMSLMVLFSDHNVILSIDP